MNIINLKNVKPIHCIFQAVDESRPEFSIMLNKQLILQKELYTFFGTQPIEIIKKYLMFIPKGSLFFHGDNINEGEILYTKLKIPEKISLINESGLEFYQYRINIQDISFDGPVVKIKTKMDNGDEIINTITQASALLSKASNLRLVSNIKFSFEEIKKKIADEEFVNKKKIYKLKDASYTELFNLYNEIEEKLDFIYNISEQGLIKKNRDGFVVFDQEWARTQKNSNYRFNKPNPQYLTTELLTNLDTELNNKIYEFCQRKPEYEKDIREFHLNCKEYFTLISKPEDEFLKPPAKTQFFGNPCAETNIALLKGAGGDTTQVKTNAKYLYSMQVYMIQNNIYLLDYWKLSSIFDEYPEFFRETISINAQDSFESNPTGTGIDKRTMFWGNYFKGIIDSSDDLKGIFTLPFTINPEIKLTSEHTYSDKSYEKLNDNYTKYNDGSYKYKLRNYQPNEDSPVITHLNYILSLRGYSISIQGYTDFDPSETYIVPKYCHPRIWNLFNDEDVIGRSQLSGGMVCREYTIFNSPKNLLFLSYSSTLPNYRTPITEAEYNKFFGTGTLNKQKQKQLVQENNNLSDINGEMFVDFSQPVLFDKKKSYTKKSINIFQNRFKYGKKDLKIIQKKYTNPDGKNGPQTKNIPQFDDLQEMLDDFKVRRNIYNTILEKLSKIKYTDERGERWYLSFINSKLFQDTSVIQNTSNYFKGLKLILISERLTLERYCSYPDNHLISSQISNYFKNISEFNFSNLINNVSSGKIENFQTNSFSPFDGENIFMLDVELQKEVIKKHDTTDYAHNHFNGALFELIRYNHNCPNNWENMRDKMTPPETNLCYNIASKISSLNDPILQEITSLGPINCTADRKKCIDRINKLVSLYNVNSELFEEFRDDHSFVS